VPPLLADLYHYAWFIGFAVAFVVYLAGRKMTEPVSR
jgi:cytosine/uracil/thiamine/allantoin permease